MRSPADPADVEEQPSDGGLDAEDIKFLRSLRTSATPGPSSDGEGRRPGHCPRLPRSQLLDVGVDHGGMMGEMP